MLDSMKRIVSAALVAAAAILAVSCGTRNDGKDKGNEPKSEGSELKTENSGVESAVVSFSYSVTEDVLRVADVKIEAVGAYGTISIHDVSSEGCKCDLTVSELPATVSFRPVFSQLESVEPADTYRLGSSYRVSVTVKDASGQHAAYSTSSPVGEMTIKPDKVAEWVSRQNGSNRVYSYTIDAQGKVQAH